MVNNCGKKIHQTWGPPFSRPLYMQHARRDHSLAAGRDGRERPSIPIKFPAFFTLKAATVHFGGKVSAAAQPRGKSYAVNPLKAAHGRTAYIRSLWVRMHQHYGYTNHTRKNTGKGRLGNVPNPNDPFLHCRSSAAPLSAQ